MNFTLQTAQDYMELPQFSADARFSYGEDASQFADLFLPDLASPVAKAPVIVLIHGGFWKAAYGLEPISCLAHHLRQQGFAVWSLEYRRVGNGGAYPRTHEDIQVAVQYLTNIEQSHRLDLQHVICMGHSAGGYLALWAAITQHNPQINIKGVISLAGAVDLVEGARQHLGSDACQALMNGEPEERAEDYQKASILSYLPLTCHQWHIIGEYDDTVPLSYLKKYIDFAQHHGKLTFDVVPNIGHFEVIDPTHTLAWQYVLRAVKEGLEFI